MSAVRDELHDEGKHLVVMEMNMHGRGSGSLRISLNKISLARVSMPRYGTHI
jgi:hypothetical protein